MTEQASARALDENEGAAARLSRDSANVTFRREVPGLTGVARETVDMILDALLTGHLDRYVHARAVATYGALELQVFCDHDQLWRDVAAAAQEYMFRELFSHVQFPSD